MSRRRRGSEIFIVKWVFLSFNRTDTTNDSLKIITPMSPISQGEDIYTLTGPISDHFWSPDGSKIAFWSRSIPHSDIFIFLLHKTLKCVVS